MGHLECKVTDSTVVGDHTLFTAEVVAASADERIFDGSWRFDRPDGRTLHYLGGRRYAAIGEVLEAKVPG
jgi:flavin reductase (DIM6/NTAB) family NADH-FMN oxidoreductase RutF